MKTLVSKYYRVILFALIIINVNNSIAQIIDTSFISLYDEEFEYYRFKNNLNLNIDDALQSSFFDLPSNIELELISTMVDPEGLIHYRFQETYFGKAVFGVYFQIHANEEGVLTSANGKVVDVSSYTPPVSIISKSSAINYALAGRDTSWMIWKNTTMENSIKNQTHDYNATYYPNPDPVVWIMNNEGESLDVATVYFVFFTTLDTLDSLRNLPICHVIDAETGDLRKQYIMTANLHDGKLDNQKFEKEIDNSVTESTALFAKSDSNFNVTNPVPSKISQILSCNGCTTTSVPFTTLYYGDHTVETDEYQNYPLNCSFRLRDACNSNTIIHVNKFNNTFNNTEYNDSDNEWDNNDRRRDAASALWVLKRVVEYFYTHLGWKGWANDSNEETYLNMNECTRCSIFSGAVVHDCELTLPFITEYVRWNSQRKLIEVSDNCDFYTNRMISLDVIGHEFFHGVFETLTGLTYFIENGNNGPYFGNNTGSLSTISEAVANIFGTVIESYAVTNYSTGRTPNYIVGELCTSSQNWKYLDSKSQNQPYTFGDPNLTNNNENVIMQWFYFLAEGGTGTNYHSHDYCVKPIGIDNAARILFNSLYHFNVSTANNNNIQWLMQKTIESAENIYGISSSQADQTRAAWHAVGVNSPYNSNGNCNSSFSSHISSGVESFHSYCKLSIDNFTALSSSDVTLTSSTSIEIVDESEFEEGSEASIYITEDCSTALLRQVNGHYYETPIIDNVELDTLEKDANVSDICNEFNLVPNPAQNFISVASTTSNVFNYTLILVDIFGKIVSTNKMHDTSKMNIDLTAPINGIYYLHLSNDRCYDVKKVIISK